MKNIFKILIINILALVSCQKVEFDKTNLDKPIVDGIVYANQNPTIHLSLPIGYGVDSTIQVDINNAKVSMLIAGEKTTLTSIGKGDYTNKKVFLKAGQTLDLTVEYAGNTLTASTVVPTKPKNLKASVAQIQIVVPTGGGGPFGGGINQTTESISWDNDIQEYYALLSKNTEISPEQIQTNGGGFGGNNGGNNNNTPSLHRLLQPVQTNIQTVNQRQFSYYGNYQFILFKVNSEYTNLYNNRGQSSLNLTNPPTNIVNGFGIFTAMNADTINIKVIK